jgi:hypothetical protein
MSRFASNHRAGSADGRLGYVYYATLYKRLPALITSKFKVLDDKLDKVFRRVAWQVVTHRPLSGVTDQNGDGIGNEIK